ncbi:hypothetical protein [Halomonas sp.]|uniref:hypothetical protein n=1 Tax=Halomonas sp. TaxID=1486246 RepID=UPI003569C759
MAELTTAGYQSLRNYVNSESASPPPWDYIELYDETQSAITRVSITGDTRCQWLDADGDNTLQVEISLQGSDADIPQPTTIKYSALWDASSGGNQLTPQEQFAEATLNQDGDSVVITHSLNIPQ